MSKVVFVGNVPYNMGEEPLIEVFKTVGPVVGLRLVFDRETGKPRGYGFCEFADHETAASAVRNLHGYEVGGRPLRIDLADSDPFLEGKTTVRGEIVDGPEPSRGWGPSRDSSGGGRPGGGGRDMGAFLNSVPKGVPLPPGTNALDAITQTLATINPSQLIEVLAQMKAFIITHPDHARALLVAHPQLAYALFQALLLNKIVDPSILQRMLAATTGPAAPPPAPPVQQQQPPPPVNQPPAFAAYGYPSAPSAPPAFPGYTAPPPTTYTGPYGAPPTPAQGSMGPPPVPPNTGAWGAPPPQAQTPGGGAYPGYGGYRQGGQGPMGPPLGQQLPVGQQQQQPQQPLAQAQTPELDPETKAMMLQVINLTPEQVAMMPPDQQKTINELKAHYSILLN